MPSRSQRDCVSGLGVNISPLRLVGIYSGEAPPQKMQVLLSRCSLSAQVDCTYAQTFTGVFLDDANTV